MSAAWDKPHGAISHRRDLESQTVSPLTKQCQSRHISLNRRKKCKPTRLRSCSIRDLDWPPTLGGSLHPVHENTGGMQRTQWTASCITLWPSGVLTHGCESEGECLCGEQVPQAGYLGYLWDSGGLTEDGHTTLCCPLSALSLDSGYACSSGSRSSTRAPAGWGLHQGFLPRQVERVKVKKKR